MANWFAKTAQQRRIIASRTTETAARVRREMEMEKKTQGTGKGNGNGNGNMQITANTEMEAGYMTQEQQKKQQDMDNLKKWNKQNDQEQEEWMNRDWRGWNKGTQEIREYAGETQEIQDTRDIRPGKNTPIPTTPTRSTVLKSQLPYHLKVSPEISSTCLAVYKCTVFLAGRCDGAQKQDGVGFNGRDTEFGHSLAEKKQDWWTEKMYIAAQKMLKKYWRQLEEAAKPREWKGNGEGELLWDDVVYAFEVDLGAGQGTQH